MQTQKCVYVMIRHRETDNCNFANDNIIRAMRSYSFNNFTIERCLTKCPNNGCEKAIVTIVPSFDYERLRSTVIYQTKSSFHTYESLRDVMMKNFKIRTNPNRKVNIEVQTSIDRADKEVIAAPLVAEMCCQTEEKREISAEKEDIRNKVVSHFQVQEENDDDDCIIIEQPGFTCMPIPIPIAPALAKVKVEIDENSTDNSNSSEDSSEQSQDSEFSTEASEAYSIEQNEMPEVKKEVFDEETQTSLLQNNNNNNNDLSIKAEKSTSSTTPKRPANTGVTDQQTKRRKRESWFTIENCERCLQTVNPEDPHNVYDHILEDHMTIDRYYCTLCHARFGTCDEAFEHLSTHGSTNISYIRDDVSQKYLQVLQQLCIVSFPDFFRNLPLVKFSDVIRGCSKESMYSVFPPI